MKAPWYLTRWSPTPDGPEISRIAKISFYVSLAGLLFLVLAVIYEFSVAAAIHLLLGDVVSKLGDFIILIPCFVMFLILEAVAFLFGLIGILHTLLANRRLKGIWFSVIAVCISLGTLGVLVAWYFHQTF